MPVFPLSFRPLTLISLLLILAAIGVRAAPYDEYAWSNVRVGGGGYITGLAVHPTEANLVYARTDVGGAYRWDAVNERWVQLFDWITRADSNLYGADAMALDEGDPNVVYMALGKRLTDSVHGIYKSTDRGATWSGPYLSSVPSAANDQIVGGRAIPFLRNAGERLAVDPWVGGIVWFGTRSNGLYKSVDGGLNWNPVTIPNSGASGLGVSFVAIDRTSGSAGNASTRLYIGVCGSSATGSDGGVYVSANSGGSWTKLTGANANQPRRGQCSRVDGRLWVTHERGVATCAAGGSALTDVTPSAATSVVYNALALDPSDAAKAVVMRGGPVHSNTIYRTTNTGGAWSTVTTSRVSTVPWWPSGLWAGWPSAMFINPFDTNELWYSDWYGIWRKDDYASSTPPWTNLENGHEEIVLLTLACPPGNGADLFSGCADMDGFRHGNGPDAYPSFSHGNAPGNGAGTDFQATFGLDYCESDPNHLVRAAGDQDSTPHGVSRSSDNGVSWTACAGWNGAEMPLRVAMSATDPNRFLVTVSGGLPKYTTDGGATFNTVSGAGLNAGPMGPFETSRPLVADRVNPLKFYYYDRFGGEFFYSVDGGQTFTAGRDFPDYDHANVFAIPGKEGHVLISIQGGGLWRSTNGGVSFTEIRSPLNARLSILSLGLGKQASGTEPWLYIYGTVDGVEGVHLSPDAGASWQKVNPPPLVMGSGPM